MREVLPENDKEIRKGTRPLLWGLLILLVCAAIGLTVYFVFRDGSSSTPTAEPTPTTVPDTPTPTEEVKPTDTVTPTENPTATPTEAVTPTEEPTPTDTATPSPTEEPKPTDTATPTSVPDTPTPTNTPKPTATPTNTPTPTKAPTPTNTPKPTATPTKKVTPTPTNTPTPTYTPTPTIKPVQKVTMWVKTDNLYMFNAAGADVANNLHKGDTVTVLRRNIYNDTDPSLITDEIEFGGGVAYVWESSLSETYIEGKWSEPRERTDIEELLMAKVQAYRKSKGVRQLEDPHMYYEVNGDSEYVGPNLAANMKTHGLRVAKKSCLESSADHEGNQIGSGWYGPQNRPSASEVAAVLYQNWYDSPGHNANMLTPGYEGWVVTGVMTVVEYYDGNKWNYCAIMTTQEILKDRLPSGLE